MEHQRYFPVRGERIVASIREGSDLVFAAREQQLENWISAMERIGPVEIVEPAGHSLARSLSSSGLDNANVLLLTQPH